MSFRPDKFLYPKNLEVEKSKVFNQLRWQTGFSSIIVSFETRDILHLKFKEV